MTTIIPACPGLRDRESFIEEALHTLLTSLDLEQVLRQSAHLLRKHFGQTRIAIYQWHPENADIATLLWLSDAHHNEEKPPRSDFPLTGTLVGQVLQQRSPLTLDPIEDQGLYREESLRHLGYTSLAVFPLQVGTRLLGALSIAHGPDEGLLCRCFHPAQRLSLLVAIALHNSLMVEEIRSLNQRLGRENSRLKEEVQSTRPQWLDTSLSPPMQDALRQARLVAPSDTSVLLRGETGTGKEGMARLIHQLGPRAHQPFVAVNLGAIPEALVESELFGHEKGAFTGAVQRRLGRFEEAHLGTLFLDEVGDAPLPLQIKLLRALQERHIQRVGGKETLQVDVRVIAATNRDLEAMVAAGEFRADLYYRLNIFPITLPPLRERRGDLPTLARHLLHQHARRMNRRPPHIDAAAQAQLQAHHWPGNIRELENLLERALILSVGDTLDLRAALGGVIAPAPTPGPAAPTSPDFDTQVAAILRHSLAQCGGKIYGPDGAAAQLGLPPTTLQAKLRRYGLRPAKAPDRSAPG